MAGNDIGRSLVVYCGFVACRSSTIAAARLTENGDLDVLKYPGGIAAREKAGYPFYKDRMKRTISKTGSCLAKVSSLRDMFREYHRTAFTEEDIS